MIDKEPNLLRQKSYHELYTFLKDSESASLPRKIPQYQRLGGKEFTTVRDYLVAALSLEIAEENWPALHLIRSITEIAARLGRIRETFEQLFETATKAEIENFFLPILKRSIQSDDFGAIYWILLGGPHYFSPRAVGILCRILQLAPETPGQFRVSEWVADYLKELADPRSIESLTAALDFEIPEEEFHQTNVRVLNAIFEIARIHRLGGAEAVIRTATGSPVAEVRQAALSLVDELPA